MKNIFMRLFIIPMMALGFISTYAQKRQLEVNASNIKAKIKPTMYGIFFEDINFAADGGLYAEMVKNRSFEFQDPKMGWTEPNSQKYLMNPDSGFATLVKYIGDNVNKNYIRVKVENDKGYSLINEGYRGMGVKKAEIYNLSVNAAQVKGNIEQVNFSFIDSLGNSVGQVGIKPRGNEWKIYEAQIIPSKTLKKARLKIDFVGEGSIDLDMISIFPADTWKGRKKGMRKDLVQLLYDLSPGFLRFPGGCIVEGRTLDNRYQWKKTIGPIQDREVMINRWNTEFSHKLTPDYFQSFGIGFFEYFQLAEDLGAEPLPILSCGMACQFNTGQLVPLEDLDPYIQDALDLIEFANGDVKTKWGKIRNDMGHPEPFNLKYIGVGNEQWGEDYFERFKLFQSKIRSEYPDITIVSGSGPFPEGDYFEYGWKELKKLNVDLVDEHYYKSPEWFLENADRYDTYDRNGPKIFAGEYAAHPKEVKDGPEENNWEAAISEAAFMTGLERNADIVELTSYAPLMAHSDAWQWAPDLIWFDNLSSYGTPSYFVQKLFSTNKGTDLISIYENGNPLVGQQNLFASAVTDVDKKELIIKLVNSKSLPQKTSIHIKGVKLTSKGKAHMLFSDDLRKSNSFKFPKAISPVVETVYCSKGIVELELKKNSLTVLKFKIK